MILLIYNETICKEILLPGAYDMDMKIELDSKFYGLGSDVVLKLENMGGEWYLRPGSDYTIGAHRISEHRHKSSAEGSDDCRPDRDEEGQNEILSMKQDASHGVRFFDGSVTELVTRSGEQLIIVASSEDAGLSVMTKYDLSKVRSISIGSREDNAICYRFQNFVSASHMTINYTGSKCTVVDTSSNGVFSGSRRVRGVFSPEYGEHINIFGLHIIFFYPYILIGVNCGELSINEEMLPRADMDSRAYYNGEVTKREHVTQYFNRAPRGQMLLYRDKIEIEAPPQPSQDRQKPTYLVIGPAFSMAIPMVIGFTMMFIATYINRKNGGSASTSPFMFMGLTIAIGAAIVGAVWAVLNLRYDKEQRLAGEEQRFNAYSGYLVSIVERLREYYRYNTEALLSRYPSASECVRYNRHSPELWNRNQTHEDFLFQRIGLGEQDFQVKVDIPKEKFTLISDSLKDRPALIKDEFKRLIDVPAGVNLLEHKLIGIVGGAAGRGATTIMHTLASGIAAAHSYTDVKLVFLYDENQRNLLPEWECLRWFPHVWSEDHNTRFMAGTDIERNEVIFHLTNVIRTRAEAASDRRRSRDIPKPYYVIFIAGAGLLEGELLSKYIYAPEESYGITTVLLADSQQQLPNSCDLIIENDRYFQGIIDLNTESDENKQPVRFDTVDRNSIEQFGKVLSNISVREVEESSEIPASLGFLEMYDARCPEDLGVSERWRKNRTYNTMKALIGRKAGGQDCYLDIHEKYHGPHGLVAGTTGSGKSETLQTYLLSLAVNYSPADVSFFVIDYKGGGMANLFTGLPHLAGQISNLSGNQVRRAMISIKSENLRRQRLFAQNGVNHINAYTRLYKEHVADIPIPHLFIVIDEFAELKREEPDFMRELISVAQVGRSLGVHLILATQKPSGTVDDNIQANSKFRLCLRVQDRQDSIDMLHKPDAAYLTQAGRCYLQVGNDEIFELFQSGYSGAIYTGESQVSDAAVMIGRTGKTELMGRLAAENEPGRDSITEMEAIIRHLREVAEREGYDRSPQLWMPVLDDHIILDHNTEALPDGSSARKTDLCAVVGRYDDPERQYQGDLIIDFAERGHLAVCGSIVSGKSTFLQTLIYSLITTHTPEEIQMYILDFSGQLLMPFAEAPHVGGTVTENQPDRIDKFFVLLKEITEDRKKLLKGGNFSQYRQAYSEPLPALFIIIDNFSAFRDKTGDRYDADIVRLVREGAACGIFLAVSASGFGMSDIPGRIGDHINNVISLEQQDKYKYMDVLRTTRLQIMPEAGIRGRGLTDIDGRILEFQTALCLEAEDDYSRGQKIETMSAGMAAAWHGMLPRPIPEIPDNPTMELLEEDPEYKRMLSDPAVLPVGYDAVNASILSIDLRDLYCMVVSGRTGTGKTTIIRSLIFSASRKDADIVVIENKKSDFSKLEQDASSCGGQYAGSDAELYKYFAGLQPVFTARNRKKQQLIKSGLSEDEVIEGMMDEKPVFIFIDDLAEFIHMIYKPSQGVGQMSGFAENIIEKGRSHRIYFIAGLKAEDEVSLTAYKAYKFFVSYKRGIHAGGNLAGQKLFQFQNIPFSEQGRIKKKGYVYISDNEDENMAREAIIPVVKGKTAGAKHNSIGGE